MVNSMASSSERQKADSLETQKERMTGGYLEEQTEQCSVIRSVKQTGSH